MPTKLTGTKFSLSDDFSVARSTIALSSPVSVKAFGATGDGVTNDSAAFQEFVTHCATKGVRGVVDAPLNLANTTITVPSNTDIECAGAGKLINGKITISGTLGAAVGLTGDAAKGATTISAPTDGISAGDVLFVRSCINCLSADAGDDRLGAIAGVSSFFAEFCVVASASSGTITLENPLIFPYTTTPGAASGSRTNSTIQKVSFAQNVRLRNLVMDGRATGALETILCALGRNVEISGTFSDAGESGYFVRFHRSYQCEVSNARTTRPAYSQVVGIGSTYNHFMTTGSQQCGFRNLVCVGGYQCVDFTFLTSSAESNPSISCYVSDSRFTQSYDGATSHAGCWNCIFENVHALNCERGFRIRSRNDILTGFSVINTARTNGGLGVYVANGFTSGAIVGNGTVRGLLYGMQFDLFNADGEPTVRGGVTVSNVTASDCSVAAYLDEQPAKADYSPLLLDSITAIRCGDGIRISAYNHGVTIRNFTAVGPFSNRAGIEWANNIAGLAIDGARFINLGEIYGIRGPSNTAFITDTTTFPTGNAAAKLTIRNLSFDGQTAGYEFVSIIRDSSAFAADLQGYSQSYVIGAQKVRLQTSQTTDLQEWQNASGTKLLGVSDTGKLTGSVATTVKDAVAASADVAALKTALAELFD